MDKKKSSDETSRTFSLHRSFQMHDPDQLYPNAKDIYSVGKTFGLNNVKGRPSHAL